jgi:glutamate N-acetyltransferase / amino-acid N-acetyltransferase
MAITIIQGGITAPKGFKANGLCCGIKKSGKPDLSLITSDVPCVSAGVFTKNSVVAAPLIVTRKKLRYQRAQAIVTNSGNANCFTGQQGITHAKETSEIFGDLLNIDSRGVLVSSTGIIGKPLPFKKIKQAAQSLVNGLDRTHAKIAAQGILTTDLVTKEIAVRFTIDRRPVRIGAMAKGSGMIAPHMATMLAYIASDVSISAPLLKLALLQACEQSFNRITIDNCMSTNDMVIVMANGQAQNKKITKKDKNFFIFRKALSMVCLDLAKKIVRDAEGATKFITICVNNAKNEKQATKIAFAIANSNLVKTAAYGSNPNWGRVAAAVGALELPISEDRLKIKFSSFAKKDITISVDVKLGKSSAKVYTSDLSVKYVEINGKYN